MYASLAIPLQIRILWEPLGYAACLSCLGERTTADGGDSLPELNGFHFHREDAKGARRGPTLAFGIGSLPIRLNAMIASPQIPSVFVLTDRSTVKRLRGPIQLEVALPHVGYLGYWATLLEFGPNR